MLKLLLALAMSLVTAGSALAQTVILARHGEKADQSADPILSPAGQARAQALVASLARAGVTHILVTPLQRTRLTASPVAQARSLTPEVISLDGGGPAHIERAVARIRALPPEAVVLVVGHSNTVPAIAAALSGGPQADMADCEYDRLTIVALGAAPTTVVTRYGAPSACPAADPHAGH